MRATRQNNKLVTIIVTFNGEKWINKCLLSLRSSNTPTDIIVIDNASIDQTVRIIQGQFPEVELVESRKNLGFGAANNLGLQKALDWGYDYFFLLNQDAYVEPNTQSVLLTSLEQNAEYGIISSVHWNGDGTALDTKFVWYMREELVPGFLLDLDKQTNIGKLYSVPFVNAAAWLISRSCLIKVGKFHPMFYHYGEDDNYVHRVLDAGFQVGVHSSVKIFHDRVNKKSNKKPSFGMEIYKGLALYLLNPEKDHSKEIFQKYAEYRARKYVKDYELGWFMAKITRIKCRMIMKKVYRKANKYYNLYFEVK